MFIQAWASGSNVQRLAKCAKNVDGVLYTAYSQLEKDEPGIIHRKFFCTEVESLAAAVDKFDAKIQPAWLKVWGRPHGNKNFISALILALTGKDDLRPELNLSALAGEEVSCFMLLTSANIDAMNELGKIAGKVVPDWHIKVLNSDTTSNKQAQIETRVEIVKAKIAGKKGVIIITNQMGSRSYSVSEIQATVIAYDCGSTDATQQKNSRALTPGLTYDGNQKEWGLVVDMSFNRNRHENIERLIFEEAVALQRAGAVEDFASGVKFVLSQVDLSKINEFGHLVPVSEEDIFTLYSDNDVMLKIANISADINDMDQDSIDILCGVIANSPSGRDKKPVVGENAIKTGGGNNIPNHNNQSPTADINQLLNESIKALNASAISVYYLSDFKGDSYRDSINQIQQQPRARAEFYDRVGVNPTDVIKLLDKHILNEPALDIILQNSKRSANVVDFLF